MRQFSSTDLPAQSRIAQANNAISAWHGTRLSWEAEDDQSFNVEMRLTDLGRTQFSVHRSTGGRLVNKPVRSERTSTCVIHAALRGAQKLNLDGVDVHLEEGEFTLLNATRFCTREPGDDILIASLFVPFDMMRSYVPDPDQMLGRVFSARGLPGSVSYLLRSMLEMEQSHALRTFGGGFSLNVLDLFGLCSAQLTSPRRDRDQCDHRVPVIKAFVRAHLDDPDLSVVGIAAHFQLSPRYINMLFTQKNETLSGFIRRERLERCREELEKSDWRYRSISDLAFARGFNDLSHFCRSFKQAYGLNASDYRRRALEGEL